jgi:hypothetical protein
MLSDLCCPFQLSQCEESFSDSNYESKSESQEFERAVSLHQTAQLFDKESNLISTID